MIYLAEWDCVLTPNKTYEIHGKLEGNPWAMCTHKRTMVRLVAVLEFVIYFWCVCFYQFCNVTLVFIDFKVKQKYQNESCVRAKYNLALSTYLVVQFLSTNKGGDQSE